MFKSLSGRFLLLTIGFVMIAEVLIFLPSVARFRLDYLQSRLELAQLATLALLAAPDDLVSPELAQELLDNAEVLNIVLRRDDMRELILASPMPTPAAQTFDLRDPGFLSLIRDAIACMILPEDRLVRVIGRPVKGAGLEIEVTLREAPLRRALLAYGWNIFLISAVISVITAGLLFLAVRRLMVRPIARVVHNMGLFRDRPEDASRVITPQSAITELHEAETALHDLQSQLQASLRHKERLAQLGGAVARVSHDLRNILTTAQLLADRIESSTDPAVARVSPKLVGSLARAISLCEHTLKYGRAGEAPPDLRPVRLLALIDEVIDSDMPEPRPSGLTLSIEVDRSLTVSADHDQMFRVLSNLLRNARQAIEGSGKPGQISIGAKRCAEGVQITVADTGPGLPRRAREQLFQPFAGSVRQGGTGLGLAIASELVQGHGGRLELVSSDAGGTVFCVTLPGAAADNAGAGMGASMGASQGSGLETAQGAGGSAAD